MQPTAVAAGDAHGLRQAAGDLSSAASALDPEGEAAARAASLDLIWAAFLIDAGASGSDPYRWAAA